MTSPLLKASLEELNDARGGYDEAEAFFNGTVDEVFASQKLRDLFGDTADKYRINYARTPVDVLLERTMIQGWTCSDSAQLAAVNQVWDDNELGIECKDVTRRTFEFGDAYLIAWPDEADDDNPSPLLGGVEAYAHDPTEVRVFYDPSRPRRKSHAIHAWKELGDESNGFGDGVWHRVNLYLPDGVEQWISDSPHVDPTGRVGLAATTFTAASYRLLTGEEGSDGAGWLPSPTPGVIPVFHFRNGRPYGRPEHAEAFGPQYGINKLYLSLMGAVDHQVLPQRYVTTDAALGPQRVDAFDSAIGDASTDELTTTSTTDGFGGDARMETGPGNVWLLSGKNVKPGQFAPADSSNFIQPMESLVAQLADVCDLPVDRLHRGSQVQSGDSKRMSDKPLNDKAGDRQAQMGVTWHEFAQYICLVRGLGETDAQVAWQPPETYSDKDSWETASVQESLGIPREVIYVERGYSPELAAQWAASVPTQSPDLVPPNESEPPTNGD